jgi:hypothetical protein
MAGGCHVDGAAWLLTVLLDSTNLEAEDTAESKELICTDLNIDF